LIQGAAYSRRQKRVIMGVTICSIDAANAPFLTSARRLSAFTRSSRKFPCAPFTMRPSGTTLV
jgi:hypothetical protein